MTVKRLLMISPHGISERMSGPVIRCVEIAKCLHPEIAVTLAVPHGDSQVELPFPVVAFERKSILEQIDQHDVILVQGFTLAEHPEIAENASHLVVDLYDPYPLEDLAIMESSPLGTELFRSTLSSLLIQVLAGDFFLCASEKQRDFWLGVLFSMGRIQPSTYHDDPSGQKIIGIVPFGVPDQPPEKVQTVLKGIIPGIQPQDKVILWGGGIYDWLDPLTPIHATDLVRQKRRDVKLVFLGMNHPSGSGVSSRRSAEVIQLSKDLELIDRHVFFQPGWVPYHERQDYLLEADIGISAHPIHLETAFSFRTRILDYIWAGLPVLTTSGDLVSELVQQHGMGEIVEPENPEQMAAKLMKMLDEPRETYARREREFAVEHTWERAVQPLREYCLNPYRTEKDLFGPTLMRAFQKTLLKQKSLLRASWHSLRNEGWEAFVKRAASYASRKRNDRRRPSQH